MRSRGLVVVLALILATLATVGVFLYSQGVKEDARTGGDLVTVVVSKVDVPANTDLNTLIREGRFTTRDVPREAVIDQPITQISQLQNRRNSVFLFAGEQIPVARVQGGDVPGGLLAIPEGHQALTVALDSPRAISGVLAGGDNVTIYATLEAEVGTTGGSGTETGPQIQGAATVVLAPQVEVLRVIRPVAATSVSGGATEESLLGTLQVILAFEPGEAQRFVFALERGSVYLSLLPPDADGVQLDPLTVAQVIAPRRGPQG
ncbi:MAG: RcpC/CpaB family pilus assembly protein [Actinomycetota bacterium]